MVATALNNGAVVYGCLSASKTGSKTEKIGGKLSIFNESLREVNGGEGGSRLTARSRTPLFVCDFVNV